MARLDITIDDNLRDRGKKLYGELGMTLSTAFKIFLKQSLRDGGMPFKPTVAHPESDRYLVSTPTGMQDVTEYVRQNPNSSDNGALVRNLLKHNPKKLTQWAKADINSGKALYLNRTKGLSAEKLRKEAPDFDKYFTKHTKSQYRRWQINLLIADGKVNQTDLLNSMGVKRAVEARCMLIDYVALKHLGCNDRTLSSVFGFLNE